MAINKIDSFSEENEFLSNFYPCTIRYKNLIFPSVEHAYKFAQYCVSHDIDIDKITPKRIEYHNFLLKCLAVPMIPAGKLKIASGKFKELIPRSWHNMKVDIMKELLDSKFSNKELANMLVNTGDAFLIEGNWWNDTFWGVCNFKGQNMLGKLLMNKRAALIKEL